MYTTVYVYMYMYVCACVCLYACICRPMQLFCMDVLLITYIHMSYISRKHFTYLHLLKSKIL